MRKFVSPFCAVVMVLSLSVPAFAVSNEETEFTYDHLWATVGMQILSEEEGSIWDKNSYISEAIPLYGYDESIIAYYVGIYPDGYMIINANINNPEMLEYSYTNDLHETFSSAMNENQKIYYCGGLTYLIKNDIQSYSLDDASYLLVGAYDEERTISSDQYKDKFDDLSDTLSLTNTAKKNALTEWVTFINNNNIDTNPYSRSGVVNYNIIGASALPTSSYSYGILYGCSPNNIDYVNYYMFGEYDYVRNHCSTVSVTNMLAYYARYYSDYSLSQDNDAVETFFTIYDDYLGTGPVWEDAYREGLTSYLYYETQYSVSYGDVLTSWSTLKENFGYYSGGKNRMIYLLIWDWDWDENFAHYVNGVGYREYTTGEKYVRIFDGWYDDIDKYISWSILTSTLGTDGGYCDITPLP